MILSDLHVIFFFPLFFFFKLFLLCKINNFFLVFFLTLSLNNFKVNNFFFTLTIVIICSSMILGLYSYNLFSFKFDYYTLCTLINIKALSVGLHLRLRCNMYCIIFTLLSWIHACASIVSCVSWHFQGRRFSCIWKGQRFWE